MLIRPEPKARRALSALEEFFGSDLETLLGRHRTLDLGARQVEFFHDVVADVPAYARFLSRHGVDPSGVRTLDDYRRLPATSKQDYHRAFPLAELCRGGALERADFLALSSGSTGEPAAWPRAVSDETGTAQRFEQVLADGFALQQTRTLGIVCFALGSWVGGMYTTAACRQVAAKGYPLTLVSPGNNRAEILRTVRALGGSFDALILFGYPPFLKDVIDAGLAEGIAWADYRVRLVTAGEVFSEEWRSLVCERAGGIDPVRATASLYGTADGGVLANETPLSIALRRFFAQNPAAARERFGEARLPTLCQFDPLHRYFELEQDELLFSADGALPLVRYRILDRGGLVPFEEMIEFVREHGHDPLAEIPQGCPVRALPFVFVFGRSGFALSFYGANVYPENVAVGLEQAEIARSVTGKFVMQLAHTPDQDSVLEVMVELCAGHAPSEELGARVARSVRREVERQNSEFLNYVPESRRTPTIRLLAHADPEYFPIGVKHRYTRHG